MTPARAGVIILTADLQNVPARLGGDVRVIAHGLSQSLAALDS